MNCARVMGKPRARLALVRARHAVARSVVPFLGYFRRTGRQARGRCRHQPQLLADAACGRMSAPLAIHLVGERGRDDAASDVPGRAPAAQGASRNHEKGLRAVRWDAGNGRSGGLRTSPSSEPLRPTHQVMAGRLLQVPC